MHNTEESFRDKWERNQDLAFTETNREGSDIFNWILSRNGFRNSEELRYFLRGKKRILDAGCGNGRVTALLRTYSDSAENEIVAIDLVSAAVAARNLAAYPRIQVAEKDIMAPLDDLGQFDFIYCQEVLHHTFNPRQAFLNLCRQLNPGGEIAIYVYKKKAPVREFVDDYIRSRITGLPYEEALRVCEDLTRLGKILWETKLKIKVPELPILEIEEGTYDLQRFIYHFFMKCFWNPDLSLTENAVINYDWYHPQIASRHTLEEVQSWFQDAGLRILYKNIDFYGITMRGIRSSQEDVRSE